MESQQVWEQEIIYTHSTYLKSTSLMASPLSLWEHGYPILKDLPFMKWDMILDILRASTVQNHLAD